MIIGVLVWLMFSEEIIGGLGAFFAAGAFFILCYLVPTAFNHYQDARECKQLSETIETRWVEYTTFNHKCQVFVDDKWIPLQNYRDFGG